MVLALFTDVSSANFLTRLISSLKYSTVFFKFKFSDSVVSKKFFHWERELPVRLFSDASS